MAMKILFQKFFLGKAIMKRGSSRWHCGVIDEYLVNLCKTLNTGYFCLRVCTGRYFSLNLRCSEGWTFLSLNLSLISLFQMHVTLFKIAENVRITFWSGTTTKSRKCVVSSGMGAVEAIKIDLKHKKNVDSCV